MEDEETDFWRKSNFESAKLSGQEMKIKASVEENYVE